MFSSSSKKPSCINPYLAKLIKKGAVACTVAFVPPILTVTSELSVNSLLPDGNVVPIDAFSSYPILGEVFNVVPSVVVPSLRPNTAVNIFVNVEASSGVNVSVSPM